ncbi:hypothetical protein J2S05_002471 [Alkalicoccobacillus murimartini]|uniref:Uncharacterized protein n=1 Tax=Alkalicoccobacillus murimartini TaxID=171685 RepID=A0ABT9YII3_9BACI|nr:hypothetical protein [Alkalicoccobacillus murimartini]
MIHVFNVGVPFLFYVIMLLTVILTSRLPSNKNRE